MQSCHGQSACLSVCVVALKSLHKGNVSLPVRRDSPPWYWGKMGATLAGWKQMTKVSVRPDAFWLSCKRSSKYIETRLQDNKGMETEHCEPIGSRKIKRCSCIRYTKKCADLDQAMYVLDRACGLETLEWVLMQCTPNTWQSRDFGPKNSQVSTKATGSSTLPGRRVCSYITFLWSLKSKSLLCSIFLSESD